MQGWDSYLRWDGELLQSIRIDFDFAKIADDSFSKLLTVTIGMLTPRDDGLSSSEEAPHLWEIEDFIESQIGAHGRLAGTVTGAGTRQLYLYMESEPLSLVRETQSAFPNYRIDFSFQDDTAHQIYLDDLFPNEDELDELMNRRVLEALSRHGDVHSIPREVDHDFEFPSLKEWQGFLRDVAQPDRSSDLWESDGDGLARGSVTFSHSVDVESINAITKELRTIAAAHKGHLTGWGCTAQDGRP